MIKSMPIKLIISFIVIVLLASVFYTSSSYAIGDIMGEGKGFLDASNGENSVIKESALKGASDSIFNTLLAMAIIIAVIVAMILGIQFMVAAADEKAKIKEALMPFVAGCIVVFGSFTVWKVFIDIGQSAEDSIVGISVERPKDVDNNDKGNDKKEDSVPNEDNKKNEEFNKYYDYMYDDEFNNWYDYMNIDDIDNFIIDEEEEKVRSWSKKDWRKFWAYMMKQYGTPQGVLGMDHHLKEYIKGNEGHT